MALAQLWHERARFWPAILSVAFPCIFVFGIYQPSVAQLLRHPDWNVLQQVGISASAVDRFAQNIHGLFLFAVGCSFLRATALASLVLSAIVLRQQLGINVTAFVIGAIVVVSLGVFWYWYATGAGGAAVPSSGSSLITPVLRAVFAAARRQDAALGAADSAIGLAIGLNLLALFAGFSSLLAAFAAIAVHADARDLTAARLTERGRALQWVTIASATLLVFVTAVNKALVVWPQGLLTPESQKSYGYVAGAIANYWGAYSSGLLLCAWLPTYASLMADVRLGAEAAAAAGATELAEWREKTGTAFDFKSGLMALITTVLPALTGPGIDIIGKLLSTAR